MKNILIVIIGIGIATFLYAGYKYATSSTPIPSAPILSFTDCKNAGYPIMESYPEQCKTPDGRTFTNDAILPVEETPTPDETPGPTGETPTIPKAAQAARTALAKELKVDEKGITLVEAKATEWPDGCLGLAEKEEICSQALVPGYKITLSTQNKTYIYHTNTDGTVLRREK